MIKESELILNPDGSIYHINLRPEQVADTIILVGDPNRVPRVSAYFDNIEFSTQKREFCTHTGSYKGKTYEKNHFIGCNRNGFGGVCITQYTVGTVSRFGCELDARIGRI